MSDGVPSEGFVYFSYGASYLDETSDSMRTLLRYNPDARVCLLTDEEGRRYWQQRHRDIPLDHLACVPIAPDEPFCLFRTRLYELSPYQKTIALDSDTYILADIQNLFDLLGTFDFAAVPDEAHPAKGSIPGLKGGYAALNYYNGGVLFFRKSLASQRLFECWRQEYLACAPLDGSDEGPLVRALIRADVRFITLPREYNLRLTNKCVSFQGRVKIVHGRVRHPERLEAMLNAIDLVDRGSRVWIPTLQRVVRATAFYPYARLLSVLNLDEVQYSTSGRQPQTSVAENFTALGRRLWGRMRHALAPRPGSRPPQLPDSEVWEYLIRTQGIRSVLACGRGTESWTNTLANHAVTISSLGRQDWRRRPSCANRIFDLVWCQETAQRLRNREARRLVETLTRHAARWIILSEEFSGANGMGMAAAHWVQWISDHGFYFDPHVTLALRRLARDPVFQRAGLAFERARTQR